MAAVNVSAVSSTTVTTAIVSAPTVVLLVLVAITVATITMVSAAITTTGGSGSPSTFQFNTDGRMQLIKMHMSTNIYIYG